jgi:hypothetical protein
MILAFNKYGLPNAFYEKFHPGAGHGYAGFTIAAVQKGRQKPENEEPPGAVEIKDSVVAGNLSFPWEILWDPIIKSG